jgi:hypothetical protein
MLFSPLHKAMIYQTPDPQRIITVLPEAKLLTAQHVMVPHAMRAMQLMAHFGYPAYSPILTDYDWPRNPFKIPQPFDHQRQAAAFKTLHPRCFDLSEMRTGKTLSSLWAWDFLMQQGIIKKVLILSPLSTIYRVWENEITNHFLSRRSVQVLYGDRARRLTAAREDKDFYIINHDGLGVGSHKSNRGMVIGELAQFIRDNPDIDAIGVDEGSLYKDAGTNRYKILRDVTGPKNYLWWLTGSPTPVEPPNAWSQARIVRRDYTESAKSFTERTMVRVSQFKFVPRREGAEIAASILQPAVRFTRAEVFGTQTATVDTYEVELSPAQKKAIDDLKKTLKAQIGQGMINVINEVTLRGKLIQIACGAVYGENHEVHKIDCAPRFEMLEEIIEEAAHKLLIFAPLTSVINLLYSELRKTYTVEKVTGGVGARQRNTIFKAFQDTEHPRIIVADPGCMAHGLDCSAADTIVWFGPTDKPETYGQANARIEGPNQKNGMLIIRLAATPTEREIYRRLDSREKMQGLILDMIQEG